jgi:D-alanine-D-alanine ligase-like ATP-grasp enzyme
MEVNPNPGWSKAAKLAMMASFEGLSYPQLLETLIDIANVRIGHTADVG